MKYAFQFFKKHKNIKSEPENKFFNPKLKKSKLKLFTIDNFNIIQRIISKLAFLN